MKTHLLHYTHADGFSDDWPQIDNSSIWILVFGDYEFVADTELFQQLRQRYPTSVISGCSSSGQILGDSLHDDTLVVAVIEFERVCVKYASVDIADYADSNLAGLALTERVPHDDLKACLVLSDGLQINGADMVAGINVGLPDNVVVTGGMAADGHRFKSTWVLDEHDIPREGVISMVALYGDLQVGHSSNAGWHTFGPDRLVTRSESNVLYEMDNKPFLDLYKEYLGDLASELPAIALRFPLELYKPGEDKRLIRTVLEIDEETKSMVFAGNVPEGYVARLMHASVEQLIDGAAAAAAQIKPQTTSNALCVAVSCTGRRMVMGDDTEEELEAVLGELPPGIQQIGFYSYGELSPYSAGQCDLHNETMTLTTYYE